MTGRRWFTGELQTGSAANVRMLAWLSATIVYVQLILGAMFRHHGMRLLPHVIMAAVVTVMLLWTVMRTLAQYVEVESLRKPALLILCLLMSQLVCGFAAYLTRVVWNLGAAVPSAALVTSTVAHVSIGALLLAGTVVLAVNAGRYAPAARVSDNSGNEKAAAA
jgi:heme A synthase